LQAAPCRPHLSSSFSIPDPRLNGHARVKSIFLMNRPFAPSSDFISDIKIGLAAIDTRQHVKLYPF